MAGGVSCSRTFDDIFSHFDTSDMTRVMDKSVVFKAGAALDLIFLPSEGLKQ